MGRVDFVEINETLQEIYIKDDMGIYIMFDCVFEDMKTIQQELVAIGSYYIHRSEVLLDPNSRPYPLRDRQQVAHDLLVKES